jgi:hypothetical protein
LAACCVVGFLLLSNSGSSTGVSSQEYITKTEADFEQVDGMVQKVKDSIENDFGDDSKTTTYSEMETVINNAYDLASALETKVTQAETAISTANSESASTDVKLKAYYTSAKELGSSYKALIKLNKDMLPIMADMYKFPETLSSLGTPTTVEEYQAISTSMTSLANTLKADKPKLANLSTNSENEYRKTTMLKSIDAIVPFLEAYAKFANKMVPAIQQDSVDLANAAVADLQSAQTVFQNSSANVDSGDNTKTANLKQAYTAKADVVNTKKTAVDTEYTKLKALAN